MLMVYDMKYMGATAIVIGWEFANK